MLVVVKKSYQTSVGYYSYTIFWDCHVTTDVVRVNKFADFIELEFLMHLCIYISCYLNGSGCIGPSTF